MNILPQSAIRTALILAITLSGLIFALSCSDPCKNVDCKNGGVCNDGSCDCPPGYSGAQCEIFDSCYNIVCLNGGVCVSGDCNCVPGYEGIDCSIRSQDKYVGTYSAADACTSGTYHYSPAITSSQEITKILITDFGNFGSSVIVSATIDHSSFTVPSQTFGSVTISGTGTLAENRLTIDVAYTATDAVGGTDVCNGLWQKQ